MSGSAVLDGEVLVDGLVDVIDDLRGDLHPQFGVRQYHVFTVLRTWSGAIVGDGTPTDVATELVPQPAVAYRTRYEQLPVGRHETGDTVLTEVSLSYTFAELAGGALGDSQQWLYLLREANGQATPDTYFTLARPPTVDRERDIGWVVTLRKADVPGCAT